MKKSFLFIYLLLCLAACKQKDSQETSTKTTTDSISSSQFGISDESQPRGLKVGDFAPELVLTTSTGEKLNLASLYKNQALVIIFYRGYWCPSCSRYLSEFSDRSTELETAGAKLLAITPETYENTRTTADKTGINFTIISDPDGAVMQAFDVLFKVTDKYQSMIETNLNASISETNASKKAILPVPATFIINTDGTIVYKHFELDYNNRASVDDILKHLPED